MVSESEHVYQIRIENRRGTFLFFASLVLESIQGHQRSLLGGVVLCSSEEIATASDAVQGEQAREATVFLLVDL